MSAIRNGAWLENQVFAEPAWSVPGIIPEGCCILAGPPKIGKSFLVLAIALAAAGGNRVLGVEVQRRPVLYLALEDNARRLQARARMLLDDDPVPHEFYCLTREYAAGSVDLARSWADERSDRAPMVIVDTLEKVRGPRSSHAYADDYKVGALLQSLLTVGGSVIAVHHTRKSASNDFLDDVSGTLGLAGSVDTVITLKRARSNRIGTLSVTGRDVEEMTYQLLFDDGKWSADGGQLCAAASKSAEPKLGEKMRKVVELVNSRPQTTAADIVVTLQLEYSTARQCLRRLADEHGLITRLAAGAYGPVTVSQVSRGEDGVVSKLEDCSGTDDPGNTGYRTELSQEDVDLVG